MYMYGVCLRTEESKERVSSNKASLHEEKRMNDILDLISKKYDGNIIVHEGLTIEHAECAREKIPTQLLALFIQSNGIEEVMILPDTGEPEPIAWIVYPYKMILEESIFFQETYGIEGAVFADDGAGSPYYMKNDGRIYYYEPSYEEESFVAESLEEFFG